LGVVYPNQELATLGSAALATVHGASLQNNPVEQVH